MTVLELRYSTDVGPVVRAVELPATEPSATIPMVEAAYRNAVAADKIMGRYSRATAYSAILIVDWLWVFHMSANVDYRCSIRATCCGGRVYSRDDREAFFIGSTDASRAEAESAIKAGEEDVSWHAAARLYPEVACGSSIHTLRAVRAGLCMAHR